MRLRPIWYGRPVWYGNETTACMVWEKTYREREERHLLVLMPHLGHNDPEGCLGTGGEGRGGEGRGGEGRAGQRGELE